MIKRALFEGDFKLRIVYWGTETILGYIITSAMIVFAILWMVAEVFARLGFSYSFVGLPEVVAVFMAVYTFASIAVIQRTNQHIRIDLFDVKISTTRFGVYVKFSLLLLAAAAAAILGYATAKYTYTIYLQQRVTEIIRFPYWPFASFIPLGFLLFVIRVGIQLKDLVKEFSKFPKTESGRTGD